jgi:hypothetical protein
MIQLQELDRIHESGFDARIVYPIGNACSAEYLGLNRVLLSNVIKNDAFRACIKNYTNGVFFEESKKPIFERANNLNRFTIQEFRSRI